MAAIFEFDRVTCEAPGLEPIHDFTWSLQKGGNAVFFGVEGSGLRTIAPLMIGIEQRYEGDIRFGGESIKGLDYLGTLRYRNRIGYLHGDFGLISNMTVEQNISLRLEYYSELTQEQIREVAERLMEELGILHRRAARPVELRLSEILRTAYARAVAHDPELLIIEHAFLNQSLLDVRSVIDVLGRRAADPDRATVFITYDPQKFLDFADEYCMLYDGRPVFCGGRDEFIGSDNPYLVQYRRVSLEGPMRIR